MKKISALLITFVFLISQKASSQNTPKALAQSSTDPMQIGSVLLNLGIGVGADYGNYYGTGFGFKATAEFGLWQAGPGVITLGPEIGGSFSNDAYLNNTDYSNTFVVAGRSAWHFGWNVPNLDTYGGFSAGLGFRHYSNYYVNNDIHNSVIPAFGAFIGGSYFVKPNFGFNAEAGYDITNFQVGVVFKLE